MFDLLFGITDWLRTTFLLDFAFYLMDTPVSLFMVENFWLVPIAQVIHIASIAAAFAATLMFTLRMYNSAGMSMSVTETYARYVPWIWWGLLAIVLSGLLMITAEPIRNMVNAVFWIKMVILVITCLITIGFQKKIAAKALVVGADYKASSRARTCGALIIVLWFVIIACGRWIAYVPV